MPERSDGRRNEVYTPSGFKTRIEALTELIRWGPSRFSHAQFLLLLFYAERTLAYGKAVDCASLDQITNGIFSYKQNQWIRGGAGLSLSAIKKANTALSEGGILIRRRALPGEARYQAEHGNESTEYEINWPALQAEFARRMSAPLGHLVANPLSYVTAKSLGHVPPYNRGKSSSEEKEITGKSWAHDKRSPVVDQPTERGRSQQSNRVSFVSDDDEKTAAPSFDGPKAELAYLVEQRGGFLSEHEWRYISEHVELRGIDLIDFVAFVRPHLQNPKTRNPLGMVKSKLKAYAAMNRPAVTQADQHPPETTVVAEKCPICREVKGKGTRIDGDLLVACECATDEWRAKLEDLNQREQERRKRRDP